MAILTLLLQKEQTTAPELAEKLEVSRRTISRDIDHLCQAGIPIVTKQGAGGGISIAEGYKLDKRLLTSGELQDILIGVKSLDFIHSENDKTALTLLDKILPEDQSNLTGNHMIIDLASHYRDSLSAKIQPIRTAIEDHRYISFDYYAAKGYKNRRVEPYALFYKWSAWYLLAYCMGAADFRLFKLNRLQQLRQEETQFIPREIPEEHLNPDNRFTDEHDMTLLFHPSVEYMVIDCYGPDSYTKIKEGLLFHFQYTNEDYMASWILSFGPKVKVLAPESLKAKVLQQAVKITQLYET